MTATVHATVDTVYNADSVEWCPVEGFQDLLLCGTYQLEEYDTQKVMEASSGKQVRVGRLYLFRLQNHDQVLKLEKVWEKDMPGVLDIKWCRTVVNERPTFGLVNSVGQLRLYCIGVDSNQVMSVTETQMCDECLGLSLDWNNALQIKLDPHISASDSAGCVSVYKVGSTQLENVCYWKAHDYEAWITAFNYWDPHIVFTGGDDCTLKSWDLRMDCSSPVNTSRRHTMGVCSIQSSPVHEHLLATGSYDEQLFLWDSRQMRRPLTDIGLGGGIWRIKWEPTAGNHILTATMYNGFHIVDTRDMKEGYLKMEKHFQEHQSIGYGADWCRLERDPKDKDLKSSLEDVANKAFHSRYIIATCSFYDHILKLWEYTLFNSDSVNDR